VQLFLLIIIIITTRIVFIIVTEQVDRMRSQCLREKGREEAGRRPLSG